MGRGGIARTLARETVTGRAWLAGTSVAAVAAGQADAGRADEPWYVVVEELIDSTAVVHATPWPVLDERARLRFPDRARGFTARANRARLRALADRSRQTPRPLRVGDVFRAVFERPQGRRGDLCDLLREDAGGPALIDVSRQAREAAKVQFFAAVSPVMGEADVWTLYRDLAPDPPGGDQE